MIVTVWDQAGPFFHFSPMKHLILIALAVLTFLIVTTPRAHALFGHVAAEKERRIATEQQLIQERQANGQLLQTNQHLQTTIHVLAAGVTVALVIGAAIGSKTRRDA